MPNYWIGGDSGNENTWATANNWDDVADGSSVGDGPPGDGETVVIQSHITNDIDGADASADQFQAFTCEDGSTITIGSSGTSLHVDMKDVATYYDVTLGGTGVAFLEIDNYNEINVNHAASSPGTGQYGLNLLGVHDADDTSGRGTINIYCDAGESVGIGAAPADDMEVNKIVITGGDVTIGASVTEYDDSTAPDLEIHGGTVITKCPLGTVTQEGGEWTHEAGVVGAIYGSGGKCSYDSNGTLTNLYGDGTHEFDLTNNAEGCTITNAELRPGASFIDPYKKATLTNGLDLNRCRIEDVSVDLGSHITITPSAV